MSRSGVQRGLSGPVGWGLLMGDAVRRAALAKGDPCARIAREAAIGAWLCHGAGQRAGDGIARLAEIAAVQKNGALLIMGRPVLFIEEAGRDIEAVVQQAGLRLDLLGQGARDRKSTRLNSSH